MILCALYQTFHSWRTQFTLFSSAHGIVSRIEHMLDHKTCLNKFKNEVIRSIFSDRNGMKLETNRRGETWKIHKYVVIKQHTLFEIFNFDWRTIALQCCVGFCCTTVWISHNYTYTSLRTWASLPTTLPTFIPLGHHWTLFSLLYGSFPLAIYLTHGSVYISLQSCVGNTFNQIIMHFT